MTSLATPRICDLVMVLNEVHEGRGRNSQSGRPPRFFLPLVPLALKKEAVFDGRDELLRFSQVIGVIGFVAPGHRDHRAMMEIVVPERVNPVTPFLRRPDEDRLLRLVLGDDDSRPASRGLTDAACDGRQDMI